MTSLRSVLAQIGSKFAAKKLQLGDKRSEHRLCLVMRRMPGDW